MSIPLRVLILEDRATDADLAIHQLRRAGFMPDWHRVETKADYLANLEQKPDLILADYSLPQYDALSALELLRTRKLDIPFIIVSANIGEDIAVSAMKRGADDYLLKDRLARLGQAVTHALERKKQRQEKQQTEDALRESEERFRATFEQAAVGMALIGLDWRWLQVNQKFCQLMGYTQAQMLEQTFQDITHPDDLPANLEYIRQLLADEIHSYSMEKRYLRRDGSQIWGNLTSSLVRDAQGQPKYFISVVEDITERKRAEAEQTRLQTAIAESAMEWQLTFDAIESPVLIMDLAGRIIKLNGAAKSLIPSDGLEMVEQTFAHLGDCPLWRKSAEVVELLRNRGAAVSAQVQDEARGRTWDLSANPALGPASDEERIILIIRDVTRMVELQHSLHRNETMSLLGSLVSGVAHEVRNPLFGISSTLDAFEARFGIKDEYQRYISVLRGEVDRLNHLMKDLLDYGRPLSQELLAGSIADAIAQATQACLPLARQSKVTVVNHTPESLSFICLDKKRLSQVFLNLLENAIQHSPPGGTVTVQAEEIQRNGQSWIVSTVKDSGPGFQAGDLPRLFEPFFTRRRGGTGLGLSIVQKIVEAHAAKISVGNHPEGGAMVEINFPVMAQQIERQAEKEGVSYGEEQNIAD